MKATLTIVVLLGAIAAPAAAQERHREQPKERIVAREAARARVVSYQRNTQSQTDRTTRTLELGANGELALFNLSGDIEVSRGSGGSATLEIVKTARAATVDGAREMLGLVTVEVSERGGRAEVRTRYPELPRDQRRPFNVSVAYTVTAPAGTRLTIRSLSGDIQVHDIEGDLLLESTSGDVEVAGAARIGLAKSISGDVTISRTRTDGTLEASAVSGDVVIRDVQARVVNAHSISGAVVMEGLQCERAQANSMSGDVAFTGPLSRGGRYELKSHSGNIRLELAGDVGFDLDATTFSGTLRTELPLETKGDRGGRRSVRGVFGDGSAIVSVTTFSGNAVIRQR